MKPQRKLIALFFITVMISAFITLNASAGSSTVAKIGGKSYTSLNAAINAVKSGQTIKVVKNITTSKSITVNKTKKTNFVIDFGNYTYKYKGTDNYAFCISRGTVTIKNAKMTSTKAGLFCTRGGTLNIKSGTYTVKKNGGILLRNSSGKTNISKGTFTSYSGSAMIYTVSGTVTVAKGTFKDKFVSSGVTNKQTGDFHDGWMLFVGNGTLSVKGGTFTGSKYASNMIYGSLSSKLKISGGTFSFAPSDGDNPVVLSYGTCTISGGTFSNTSKNYSAVSRVGALSCSTLKITSGTFNGSVYCRNSLKISGGVFNGVVRYMESCSVKITGGTFSSEP